MELKLLKEGAKKLVGTQCGLTLDGIEDALRSFESRKTTRPSIKPNL